MHAASAIPRSFRLVGWTRAAVLVMMVLSSAWTAFLAVLNYAPNETANYIMNTTQFDDGEFWQLTEIDASIMGGSVIGLGVVATVYLYLVVLILKPPRAKKQAKKQAKKGPIVRGEKLTERLKTQILKPLGPTGRSVVHELGELRRQLMSQQGRYQKVWNLVLEIPEIVFQTVTLHSLLANGIAQPIVSAYVAAMVVNCVYCFYHITIAWKQHAFHEMVGDAILDVAFAIVFPAVTLLHTIRDFRDGLKWMMIREQLFPAQAYERRSRVFGDARQINTFTLAFDCLRIMDRVDLVVTVGFNLLTCLRWRRIVLMLQRAHQLSRRRIVKTPESTAPHSIVPAHSNQVRDEKTVDGSTTHPQPPKRLSAPSLVAVPRRVIPAYVGFLFLVFGGLVVLYTSKAVSESSTACLAVVHCTLYAYQWFPGAPDMACPCLVYIHGQLTMDTRAISDLVNTTPELSLAAEAGTLRTIQLVSVAIQGKLPANVKGCTQLRELILLNTDIEVLPSSWTWTFQKLQFLHITAAGKYDGLLSIPAQFFESAPSLRTLSLQGHHWLTDLTTFRGLTQLQTLYISDVWELPTLPGLQDTPRLRTLALVDMRWLTSLPDLAPVQSSLRHVYVRSCPLCCSGFLSKGVCNSTMTQCEEFLPDSPEHSCYPSAVDIEADPSLVLGSDRFPLMSDTSRTILQPFLDSLAVCDPNGYQRPVLRGPSTGNCDGVWYRQCPEGICFAAAFESPRCVNNSAVIQMRTTMIAAGDMCDPEEEAWLGCM